MFQCVSMFGIALDCICVVIAFLPTIVMLCFQQPYNRGFFCDDESIRYPYKDDTVKFSDLVVSAFALTFLTILITEFVHQASKASSNKSHRSCSEKGQFLKKFYIAFGIYIFAFAVQMSIGEIAKNAVGRLRPHFLSVCNPNFDSINCTTTRTSNIYIYVDNYNCSQPDKAKMRDARKSFPSGHSAFVAFTATFLIIYLHARFTWKGSKLLRHLFQTVLVFAAVYVCLSRITDFKHHWSDVLSGTILGIFIAAFAGIHISPKFEESPTEEYLTILGSNSDLSDESRMTVDRSATNEGK